MRIRNNVFFHSITGLSALVDFLNKPKYSTIIYVLQGQGLKDFGYCEMSQKLETAFNKTVIFWPCPKMKVSTIFSFPESSTFPLTFDVGYIHEKLIAEKI